MADRYFVNGGGTLDWSTSANWSATDGGAGGASVPTTTDNVFLTANSPNLTDMNSARTILNFDCTGYTGTFTWNQSITQGLAATVFYLSAGMTISGSGAYLSNTANQIATYTSNGKEFPGDVSLRCSHSGGGALTLADAMVVNGTLSLGTSTGTVTINGSTISAKGSLTTSGSGNGGTQNGTTVISMTGTGTFSTYYGTNAKFGLPLIINTAGTITFGTNICYGGGTFTYTAGTVITTGNTLICQLAATTLALNGITLNNLQFQGSFTHTISAPLVCTGQLLIGNSTATTVVSGSTITVSGGVRYNGTTGNPQGTTNFILSGTQTVDCPNRTTGAMYYPMKLDAPGGVITFDAQCGAKLGNLEITDGTTVITTSDTIQVVGTVAA